MAGKKYFWWVASVFFSLALSGNVLIAAFRDKYTVMDDGRQHLFWMHRLVDPEIFREDLIANFYESVSPPIFKSIYHLVAILGVEPLVFSKFVPSILGVITTSYCFTLCLKIIPVPVVGFVACILLNQNLWLASDLVTASPNAFSYPTFMAFLYYLVTASPLGVGISMLILGGCYPPVMLIAMGILCLHLIDWGGWPRIIKREKKTHILCGIGLAVGCLMVIYYSLQGGEFDPTVTVAEARQMAEFGENGRTWFFQDGQPLNFWLQASRSGFRLSLNPPWVSMSFCLPFLCYYGKNLSGEKKIKPQVRVLGECVIASVSLFFLAHLLLFKLFLPSRYTIHSLKIVMAIASAIVIYTLFIWLRDKFRRQTGIIILTTVIACVWLFSYPYLFWGDAFPRNRYLVGRHPKVYEFLQQQPQDIMIASMSQEADNLPIFSKRSVLFAWEYALPYKLGYYQQIRQRAVDLIRAQYSLDAILLRQFIEKYGVDFLILDQEAFFPEYVELGKWFLQWQDLAEYAQKSLSGKKKPWLATQGDRCLILTSKYLRVLDAQCLIN